MQDAIPLVRGVEAQPLVAQIRRVIDAAEYLGSPLSAADRRALEAAFVDTDVVNSVEAIQRILDPYCLVSVDINPEMRVSAALAGARPELLEQGWRQFLVKVHNEAGATALLRCVSPQGQSVFIGGEGGLTPGAPNLKNESDSEFGGTSWPLGPVAADRWIDMQMYQGQPLAPNLSGLPIEYRIIQIYSRDAGQREATLVFDIGQGSQDLGFRSEVPVLFRSRPAHPVRLHVIDEKGQPTIASFIVRDAQGRTYPSQAKRAAPDFAFQPQVYRGDGDVLRLASGGYTVEFSHGPESLPEVRQLTVSDALHGATFQVRRWIDPASMGWWSGDHHIHAAGCLHYFKPTEGVLPADMIRHVIGEDLKVGACLTWGPGFDYQNQFFCGATDSVSQYPYLLRYDIEVSGFGSHQSGHLVLLRLKNAAYPGSHSTEGWPTLGLNILRWAKRQGAVVGYAHSGWGLAVAGTALPTYEVPRFDGIGANEYITDVTHEIPGPDGKPVPAVDFMAAVDSPYVYELNMWYHTLNAGFRTRIAGETDFPCIYGQRVGIGRSYIKLDGPLTYDDWCEGIRLGRSYVGDGLSHLIDFKVGSLGVGEQGSELRIENSSSVEVSVKAAALLSEKVDPQFHGLATGAAPFKTTEGRPFWDIERARIDSSREVPVEVVVNGYPVTKQNILADGALRDLTFHVRIERSSWVALRILGSSHTNPIFVLVGGRPIRASKRSVEWCLKGVDQCWSQKERFIGADELSEARAAYNHARDTYRARLLECDAD